MLNIREQILGHFRFSLCEGKGNGGKPWRRVSSIVSMALEFVIQCTKSNSLVHVWE